MKRMEWGKTLTAMVTPMDAAGELDIPAAVDLARDIIAHGCDGIVVCGTTGEAATLSTEEKLRLISSLGEEIRSEGLLIAGVGGNCTRDTVGLIRQVEALPVDGYMVITPYYNKPNQAGLVQHYMAVDAASTRPIMLYNVPSRTGIDMSKDDYELVLANCPKITAVKEASPDLTKGGWLAAQFPDVDFFSGNDNLTLPLMVLGFKGVVSVAANVVPAAMAQLTALASQGDWAGARHIHEFFSPLFAALFVETNPVPVKAALELQGWPAGSPRLPLARLSRANTAWLAEVMKNYTREGR